MGFSKLLWTDCFCVQYSCIVMFAVGLDGASGSDTWCLSCITVYGDKSKYTEEALTDLESRFQKRMSEFLKLNDASLVDVRIVGSGSITFFFLLPLGASLRLWEAWRKHPRSVQSAMRGLVDNPDYPNDPIPVICISSIIGIKELHMINQHRSRLTENKPTAGSGEIAHSSYLRISWLMNQKLKELVLRLFKAGPPPLRLF